MADDCVRLVSGWLGITVCRVRYFFQGFISDWHVPCSMCVFVLDGDRFFLLLRSPVPFFFSCFCVPFRIFYYPIMCFFALPYAFVLRD